MTCEEVLELYRVQIRYLLAELKRVGWTQYPVEPVRWVPYPPEDVR